MATINHCQCGIQILSDSDVEAGAEPNLDLTVDGGCCPVCRAVIHTIRVERLIWDFPWIAIHPCSTTHETQTIEHADHCHIKIAGTDLEFIPVDDD